MTVTEIAVFHSTSAYITNEFRHALDRAQTVQDRWIFRNSPLSPSSRRERGVAMFEQVQDPSVVLLTAKWDSVAAHEVWIQSEDNKELFDQLQRYIVFEGEKKIALLHLDVEIFLAESGSLLDSAVISVTRIVVAPGQKGLFTEEFNQVKRTVEDYVRPHPIKGGWRIDKEKFEEFVLICGWDSVEQHIEFSKTKDMNKYRELVDTSYAVEVAHYRRFM